MSKYNSNYGSHDQLQDLRKSNMVLARHIDEIKKDLETARDELVLALEALVRYRNPVETVNWRNIATMMSHFDVCTSARLECNICHEARQAYIVALTT
jgi:hypothetical protein